MRIRWRNLELPSRVVCEEASPTYGRFVVEPFERGFGITVGNSLRRILLSSLEGTAVTGLRISGVEHEFQAIPGIYEDVAEVILNVKQLLVRLDGDEPTTLRLSKTGKGPVTAAAIETDHRTEIVNPDLHICSIVEAKKSIELTLTVARGRGYVTADENAGEGREIGSIPVDSPFSPVQRVRYWTENTRVGKMTNYDKLFLEIWTNGTVSPEMALVEAAKILRKHLNPFVQYFEQGREVGQDVRLDTGAMAVQEAAIGDTSELNELRDKLLTKITDLHMSQRATNSLVGEEIHTLADLCRRTESDMLKLRNFGKNTLAEIEAKLTELGLELGMDVDTILGGVASG